jgi:hypothetical protein
MIAVEVGHAHVITFLSLSCELSVLSFVAVTFVFCRCHCHFLGEKCGDEIFIYFEFILSCFAINFRNIELFCTQFNSCV